MNKGRIVHNIIFNLYTLFMLYLSQTTDPLHYKTYLFYPRPTFAVPSAGYTSKWVGNRVTVSIPPKDGQNCCCPLR